MPFEIKRVSIIPNGFKINFTKPVDATTGNDPNNYRVSTFTHIYHGGYGGPEVDKSIPNVLVAKLSADGLHATIRLDQLTKGHVHEFDLGALRSRERDELLHRNAYYTVNEIPEG